MKKRILLSITVLLVVACAEKTMKKTVIIGESMTVKRLPSTISFNENYQLADTTVVHISGKIYGSYIHHPKDTVMDELAFAKVSLIDTKTKTTFSELTSEDATCSLFVPAGTYQLEVQYVGYVPIVVAPLQCKAGEIINFSANLGQGIEKDIFKVKQTKHRRKVIRVTE
jgi:hypothetical protein